MRYQVWGAWHAAACDATGTAPCRRHTPGIGTNLTGTELAIPALLKQPLVGLRVATDACTRGGQMLAAATARAELGMLCHYFACRLQWRRWWVKRCAWTGGKESNSGRSAGNTNTTDD